MPASSGFRSSPGHATLGNTVCIARAPRNVKCALALVVRLFLEHSKVTESSSMVEDSAMLLIQETTNADVFHSNSFGKVNANFAHFVIDFLSLLLLFDAYTDHNANASPAPWAGRNF
jgi:hypothetical protein